jgi:hypothetical protein
MRNYYTLEYSTNSSDANNCDVSKFGNMIIVPILVTVSTSDIIF